MTAFEYVLALLSVITSLGLAHLVSGFVALASRDQVRFSAEHCLWALTAFATTIGNWGALWQSRALTSWPAWLVLLSIATAIGQYAFCVLVTPYADKEAIDLAAFHDRQHRRYAFAYMLLIVLAVVQNVLLGWLNAYAGWLRDTIVCFVLAAFVALTLLSRRRWAQLAGSIGFTVCSVGLMILSAGIPG
jgi:hypothetical protein